MSDADLIPRTCWLRGAGCCRAGKMFMTIEEVVNIGQSLFPNNQKEFHSRLEHHTDFCLYDRRDRCQFLDHEDFCELHYKKLKPAECRWWPIHAYAEDGRCVIRVAECGCVDSISAGDSAVREMKREMQGIGEDRILRFRKLYPGTCATKPLKED